MHSIVILNFDINFGRVAWNFNVNMGWEVTIGRNFEILMLILGGLCERHAAQRGIWIPTPYLF
jgi:hypothetical protein